MNQQLRVPAALAQDPGSVPLIHTVPDLYTPAPEDSCAFMCTSGHADTHTYTQLRLINYFKAPLKRKEGGKSRNQSQRKNNLNTNFQASWFTLINILCLKIIPLHDFSVFTSATLPQTFGGGLSIMQPRLDLNCVAENMNF